MKDNSAADLSVEQILASIRRIMIDEPEPKSQAARAGHGVVFMQEGASRAATSASRAIEQEDGFEAFMSQAEATETVTSPQPAIRSITDSRSYAENMTQEKARVEQTMNNRYSQAEPLHTQAEDEVLAKDLLSDNVLASTSEVLTGLTNAAKTAATVKTMGARTVDSLVQEMLRPLLSQWLNAHLPAIVERIVAEEIKKLADQAHS